MKKAAIIGLTLFSVTSIKTLACEPPKVKDGVTISPLQGLATLVKCRESKTPARKVQRNQVTGFYQEELIRNNNKICIYNASGTGYVLNWNPQANCPATYNFQAM